MTDRDAAPAAVAEGARNPPSPNRGKFGPFSRDTEWCLKHHDHTDVNEQVRCPDYDFDR
jgi:hypothetical protein